MIMLMTDIGIEVLIIILFLIMMKTEKGFFSIMIPYAFPYYAFVIGPVIMTMVNLGIMMANRHLTIYGFVPLLVVVPFDVYVRAKDLYNTIIYNREVVPVQQGVKQYLDELGFQDPSFVHVITKRESKKEKGRIQIELFQEDSERLEPVKNKIKNELKMKYPEFSVSAYSNSFVTRKERDRRREWAKSK